MTEAVPFVKMSGAGNDFIVIEAEVSDRLVIDLAAWTRAVCRRALSVGADGVLVVRRIAANRIGVRYFNADGSDAFCGNGSRCAARYAWRRGWVGSRMELETAAGEVEAEVTETAVRLRLPPPEDLGAIGFEEFPELAAGRWIRAGVPHVTVRVAHAPDAALDRFGPVIRRDTRLGIEGANVDAWSRGADGAIHLRTWERGVEGETLACGSGAVAVALAARREGRAERQLLVPRSGVPLVVELPDPTEPMGFVVLEGDARFVFEATLDDEALAGPAR